MSDLNHRRKLRHNHFLRHSDVRVKDERRPTVNELANQKYVEQKINGWKIYHLSAGMEDAIESEAELSQRLLEFGKRLESASGQDIVKDALKVQELIQANIQRSTVIQNSVLEAKDSAHAIFEHKNEINNIVSKYQSKQSTKGRREN